MLYCPKSGDECYGVREIRLLLEISKHLNSSLDDLPTQLKPVLDSLLEYLQAQKAMITIVQPSTSSISIDIASGLTADEQQRGLYKVGEGIIGKVVETCKPMIIPNIFEHPDYLNKTGIASEYAGNPVSFICVPIRTDQEIVGTLSIHKIYTHQQTYVDDEQILLIVGTIIAQTVKARQKYVEELQRLKKENLRLHAELVGQIHPSHIIGKSGKMQAVFELIHLVAPTDATVIIRGESGTGKELIADAIHYNSLRKDQPFIKVNCAALPEALIESELFGYEKGAFTDARTSRIGRFEAANGGTIFLDEIGDLPLPTQVKLLRFMQSHEVERLGTTTPIKVDVRIICATNRNLEELIAQGLFREDFYYRISGFPIYLPPLREHRNDIPALVDHFILKFNSQHKKRIKRISSTALDMLMVYHWPGNIRELENCIERACILSNDGVIRPHNLPPTLQTAVSSNTQPSSTLQKELDRVEKQLLLDALVMSKGNMAKAASILGITERMIGLRIKKHGIDVKQYKVKSIDGKQ